MDGRGIEGVRGCSSCRALGLDGKACGALVIPLVSMSLEGRVWYLRYVIMTLPGHR